MMLSWEEINRKALLNPYANYLSFYRVVFHFKKCNLKNVLLELAGGLAGEDIKVLAASVSARIPNHINAYLDELDDYVNIHSCRPDLLLPGGTNFPPVPLSPPFTYVANISSLHPICPLSLFTHILPLVDNAPDTELDLLFNLSATNSPEVIRLFVGNVNTAYSEEEILQTIRDVVTTTDFVPRDIFSFYFHRSSNPKCQGKKSTYGFLQVVGIDLAGFLSDQRTQPFYGGPLVSIARAKNQYPSSQTSQHPFPLLASLAPPFLLLLSLLFFFPLDSTQKIVPAVGPIPKPIAKLTNPIIVICPPFVFSKIINSFTILPCLLPSSYTPPSSSTPLHSPPSQPSPPIPPSTNPHITIPPPPPIPSLSSTNNNPLPITTTSSSLSLSNVSSSLRIASFNARGSFYSDVEQYITLLKKKNISILLVQEAGKPKSTTIANMNGYTVISNDYDPNDPAGSLAIMTLTSLSSYITKTKIDPLKPFPFKIDNRLMLYKLSYPINTYIMNCYCKTGSYQNFTKIKNLNPLIIGGDLNSYPSPTLDMYSTKGASTSKPHPVVDIIKNGYHDVTRLFYPDSRIFTRYASYTDSNTATTHITASRIDYFLCSEEIINHIEDVSIHENIKTKSDHCIIAISLSADPIPLPPSPPVSCEYKKNIKDKKLWSTSFKDNLSNNFNRLYSSDLDFEIDPLNKANIASETIQKCFLEALDSTFPISTFIPLDPASYIINPGKHKKTKSTYKLYKKITGVTNYVFKNIKNNNFFLDSKAIDTIIDFNACLDPKKQVDYTLELHDLFSKLSKLQSDIYANLREIIRLIKCKRIRKAVLKKLEHISKDPQKVFKIINYKIRKPVDVVSVITQDKKIKLVFEENMVNKIQNNWEKIYTPSKPRGDISEFLQFMPKINIPSPPPISLLRTLKIFLKTNPIQPQAFQKLHGNALSIPQTMYSHTFRPSIQPFTNIKSCPTTGSKGLLFSLRNLQLILD